MTATPRIAVVDYGAGNLVSIEQALTAVGANVGIVEDGEATEAEREAGGFVHPGAAIVGSAMHDRIGHPAGTFVQTGGRERRIRMPEACKAAHA